MNVKLFLLIIILFPFFSKITSMERVFEDFNGMLRYGITWNKIDLVQKALANNADVNLLSIDPFNPGYTALHIAIYYRNLEIIKLLLNSGADINIIENKFIDRKDCDSIKLANMFIGTHYGIKIQEEYKKVLELLHDWQKKLKKEVKKEVDPYLPPVLGNIVADYVV